MNLLTHIALSEKSTLGVGGRVQLWAEVENVEDVRAAVAQAQQRSLPIVVVGGGSNIIAADGEIEALVIHPVAQNISVLDRQQGKVRVSVDAGVNWDRFVQWAVEHDLSGVTCLSGIPGSVGAAPMQNIGAYGQEISEVFVSAQVYDLKLNRLSTWDAQRCEFAYRDSALKRAGGRFLVMQVTLELSEGGRPTLRYGELARRAAEVLRPDPSLLHYRELVIEIRRSKGMVFDPRDPASRSAGSFFMNPIVPTALADEAERRLVGADRGEMPRYPSGPGLVKLSAAWLIERSGMPKGYCQASNGPPRVSLSPKHTLALVNRGGATSADILEFAEHVKQRVLQSSGIELKREPVTIG